MSSFKCFLSQFSKIETNSDCCVIVRNKSVGHKDIIKKMQTFLPESNFIVLDSCLVKDENFLDEFEVCLFNHFERQLSNMMQSKNNLINKKDKTFKILVPKEEISRKNFSDRVSELMLSSSNFFCSSNNEKFKNNTLVVYVANASRFLNISMKKKRSSSKMVFYGNTMAYNLLEILENFKKNETLFKNMLLVFDCDQVSFASTIERRVSSRLGQNVFYIENNTSVELVTNDESATFNDLSLMEMIILLIFVNKEFLTSSRVARLINEITMKSNYMLLHLSDAMVDNRINVLKNFGYLIQAGDKIYPNFDVFQLARTIKECDRFPKDLLVFFDQN